MFVTPLDIAIMAIPFAIVLGVALFVRRYTRSVADYLAASRCGGRYLITSAAGETMTGVMGMVTALEMFSRTGFSLTFWTGLTAFVMFFFAILGLVTYRMRETRALTFHQFLEVRYSKGVRIIASFLNVFSGLFSFGVAPAVGARFFVYFLRFPEHLQWAGHAVPTYAVIMFAIMAISLLLTLSGGQISMMVADSLEALFSKYLYLVITLFIVATISVVQMKEALLSGAPGKSFIDPFDIAKQPDFGGWFVAFTLLLGLYQYRGAGSSFTTSARSPHESRMASILTHWRGYNYAAMLVLISLGAFTVLHHPDFAVQREAVYAGLQGIANPSLQTQMSMPTALGTLLAPGVRGCFCAVALFGLLANQGNYIHMYSSTLLQDVVLPIRRRPFAAREHMIWLRLSAGFVACFACGFSLFFKPMDYLRMITMLLGTIYLGGISCVIWGGLYWKRGTTAGAVSAMILASVSAVACFILMESWETVAPLLGGWSGAAVSGYLAAHARKFPFNGVQVSLVISALACATYILVSLLTCRKPFNLDAMLHRGAYQVEGGATPVGAGPRSLMARLVNINPDFTRGDKALAYGTVLWSLFWQFVGLGVFLWTLFVGRLTPNWWFHYSMVTQVWVTLIVGVIVTVWFTWGILRDMRQLFRTLATVRRNDADDGTVRNHHNVGETQHIH